MFGWHWILSPPPPLPPSVRDVRTRLCQVQVQIFNAASLYHHPPRKHSTPTLPYFLHCQSYQFSTIYWSICIASKVLYIIHREQRKYLPRNVSVLSSLLVFGCEDVGGGDVSSSKCHTTWHTLCLSHSRPSCSEVPTGRKKINYSVVWNKIFYMRLLYGWRHMCHLSIKVIRNIKQLN